jgi:hypothetical protein
MDRSICSHQDNKEHKEFYTVGKYLKRKPLMKTSGEQLKTRSLRWLHWNEKTFAPPLEAQKG